MTRSLLFIVPLFFSFYARSQEDFFVLKKKDKTLQRFAAGSFIVFKLKGGEWITGDIIRIQHDSFYVRQRALRYTLTGIDTVHFGTMQIALSDIGTMPRKSAMVYYRNDKPQLLHGHEKYVYIKNGLLFQLLGGGYTVLNVTNSLAKNDPPFGRKNRKRLFIGAAVFSIGELLHLTYRRYMEIGRKYHLTYVKISS